MYTDTPAPGYWSWKGLVLINSVRIFRCSYKQNTECAIEGYSQRWYYQSERDGGRNTRRRIGFFKRYYKKLRYRINIRRDVWLKKYLPPVWGWEYFRASIRLPARFGCIFAPAWEWQKLRFASVEPSAAALVRAAFRWFKSGAAKKEPRPVGLGHCGKGSRDLII